MSVVFNLLSQTWSNQQVLFRVSRQTHAVVALAFFWFAVFTIVSLIALVKLISNPELGGKSTSIEVSFVVVL
jgi:hypothetical protein